MYRPAFDSLNLQDETSMHEGNRIKLVTLAWQGKGNDDYSEVLKLPVPYELPPKPYSAEGLSSAFLLDSHYMLLCDNIKLTTFFVKCRYSLVMGSAIYQERRLWPSLAETSKAIYQPRLMMFSMIGLLC